MACMKDYKTLCDTRERELEFEKQKVVEVENEIREILRERELEKEKIQKQMKFLSDNIFKS